MSKSNAMCQREKAWDGCMEPEKKGLRYGLEHLSDSELVALIIRSGTRNKTALQLASELLSIQGRQLLNLYELSMNDLVAIEGIGKVKALQLKAVGELSKRIAETSFRKTLALDAPSTIANYYMERMRHEDQEQVYVSLYDAKGQFLDDTVVSKGTSTYAVLSPKEIYSFAVRRMASFVVVLHNHPSGIPEPSDQDNEATQRIAACGKLLDIPLLDHIIIGDRTYYSYLETDGRKYLL